VGATSLKQVQRRKAALELLGLGLTTQEVAGVLGCSRTTLWRETRGHAIPVLECPSELTTPRARTVWRLMMRDRRRNRQEGMRLVEDRIARIIQRAGV
jgi:hypothetical protein